MNKLPTIFLAVAILATLSPVARAQDAELGIILPPPPNLDLGDPDTKLSWREKRKIAKAEEELRLQQNTYIRNPDEDRYRSFGNRVFSNQNRATTDVPARPTEIDVRNSMPSYDDAVTASGSVLQAFGEEGRRWEGMPAPPPEEVLVVLPPLPDLRTPDQVTARERFRNRRMAKYEAQRAEAEAKEREKELREIARVTRPDVDPSTALVQVQSMAGYEGSYIGNVEAPETVDQGTLRPFNSDSSYYQDQQLVYKGSKQKDPVQLWWKRGTSEAGGGPEGATHWEWRNPFRRANDDVQPVSYSIPEGESDSYSAVSPTLDSTPLTSNLSGIVIHGSTREVVGGAGGVSKAGIYGVTGIESNTIELPPKVVDVLEARLGRPLTLGELNQMVRDAVLAYRKSDFPVVDVLVPEQEISTGVLQLVIIEGRLGDVIVEGAGNSEARALASQIRTQPGEVIRESRLTEDLAWINKHPTRQVDLIFTPGGGYGETDVILRSEEYRALAAYMAYENSGTSALGESRAIFGASWTGPIFFDPNAILSYQFTTNFDDSEANVWGHSGVFASYLPWRHQITLLGAYTESSALFANGTGGSFNSNGVNKQASGRYGIALPNLGRMAHELEIGMDFKSSNSDLAFGSLQVFDTTSEIVQYSLGYNIVARDRTGAWRVDTEFVSSPGDNTNKNTDAIFMTQRTGALANYTYGRASVERDQQLPEGWSLFGRLQAQASNRNLLASETLGAGGYDSVRGFEQRIIRGDSGVVGTLELRTPTVFPSTFTGYNNVEDGAFGLLFYDAAALANKDPLPFEQDLRAGSVGLGFRYQRENWFTLRVDYGFQVSEEGFQDGESGRWHVGARATF